MKKWMFSIALAGVLLFTSHNGVSASTYEVRSGDSLWTIGQNYGVTTEALRRENNLSSNMIYPGQSLSIPGGTVTHTVKHGETLWIIANRYGVTVSQLRGWNGLSGSAIYPGQSLTINKAAPTSQAYSSQEKELLARLVHAEARGEPYKGKVAVAAVVLNRADHPDFPSSVSGVVYETYGSGNIYAFEPVQNGEIYRAADRESIRAVEDAVNGYDPTNGAVYFYNPDTATSNWVNNLTVNQRIGNHVFARQ